MAQQIMVYPTDTWRKLMFKAPLYVWRLGLGRLLIPHFLVLTTTGRKSGLPRHTMLEYSQVDGKIYIASGWGDRSQWYKNAMADPLVTVQPVGKATLSGRIERVTDESEFRQLYEAMQASPIMAEWLKTYNIPNTIQDFVANRDKLHILRVDATNEPTPPPLESDLRWITWLVGGLFFVLVWILSRSD